MTIPVVTRAEVEPAGALPPAPGRPHVAVLVSLNFPDLTEPVAELVRRFTRNALTAVTAAGASFELLDSSDPAGLPTTVTADALFLLGGGDVATACWGGPDSPVPNEYGVDESADRASIALIREYDAAGRPVLGICRGSQLINVAWGGTLIPDIADYQLHRGGPGEPLFLDEKVEVLPGTRLAGLLGAGPLTVRSGHHQAVDRVGDGLVVAARALDGIVEGVEHPDRWVLGVQFHPEDDDGSDRELRLLVEAMLRAVRPGGVRDSSPAEVTAATARAAAAAPGLATVPPGTRRRWLEAVADALEAHRDELVGIADAETALGVPRLTSEVARAASQLRFYGAVAEEGSYLRATIDSSSTPPLARVNRPLGPVAVFGASNFPLAFGVVGNDTASALVAGCPVVAKAHPAHPQLSGRLAELAREALAAAGAPDGTFGLVAGLEAGTSLVRSPEITAVGFTGSQAGGLALWRIANERDVVIPVYAEMGTVNPVVVTRAAAERRLAEVAEGFVGSFTLGHGQSCTKPGLLFAPAGHDVPGAVATALEAAAPGSATLLTAGIAAAARSGVAALVAAGAEVVASAAGSGTDRSADTVVLRAPASALVAGSALLEECFGPVAVVVEYDDDAGLDRALDALHGSLAGTVATDGSGSDPEAARLVARLAQQVGRVTVDDWPTGVSWTWAQQHGGPWPATTAPATTSVGAAALDRWVRPVAYQSVPDPWLPPALQAANPWRIPRRVDGTLAP